MAAALGRGLSAEGYVVDHVADGPAGLEAARFGAYDVVVLDIMLPGHVRLLRGPDAPRGGELGPGAHAVRQGRRARRGRRARLRRGRLPHQAVLVRGAARSAAVAAPARHRPAPHGARGRRSQPRPGHAPRPGGRRRRRAVTARVPPARVPAPRRAGGRQQGRAARPGVGVGATTRTSSRSTSGTCGASSAASGSRRSAVWATGSPTDAHAVRADRPARSADDHRRARRGRRAHPRRGDPVRGPRVLVDPHRAVHGPRQRPGGGPAGQLRPHPRPGAGVRGAGRPGAVGRQPGAHRLADRGPADGAGDAGGEGAGVGR